MWDENKIKKFEKALQGPAPEWDPDWEITQQLLKLTTVQAMQLMDLQAQLDVLEQSNTATSENLINALQQNMGQQVLDNSLTVEEVETAVSDLNKSIDAAIKGKKAVTYAGSILKFVAKVVT
ncbi:hypothetical protein [Candidatus Parabeggiatoa sp. HSG14]|uniref:hypothetical protein n=1 Tax=Candidatus Parabeggiatoa sp. HSG14 TaxID=3055593 RepID=UPI0025A83DAF|nr:hypothetical protein [Thiotrichales bacterium HSG14]